MTVQSLLLTFHIIAGALAIVSGFVSLTNRKGSQLHMKAGKTFLTSMVAMCVSGAIMSAISGITITLLVSFFTVYLVTTAWRASRRFQQRIHWGDVVGGILVTSLSVSFFYHGQLAANSPSGTIDNIAIGPTPYFVFGFVSLFCAWRDLSFVLNCQRSLKQALPSHIWRISLAMFIATSSFFTGNPQVFPEWFNQSFVSSLPEQIVLLVMIYYLFDVFAGGAIRKRLNGYIRAKDKLVEI